MEEIIIHTVRISSAGEIKHFEIPLSFNAKAVCSLWYKIRLLDSGVIVGIGEAVPVIGAVGVDPPYGRELIAGKLSLSSNRSERVFFFGDLILEDKNLSLLDFTDSVFEVKPYTHNTFNKSIEINLDPKTTTVHGFIEDNWGILNGSVVNYEVDIYIIQNLNSDDPGTGT
ncbi:MAG: hypothetical protein IT233_12610 [Bacteroidia bacterium]|nr:hypothetical protein [Bacteroidia bacterium]